MKGSFPKIGLMAADSHFSSQEMLITVSFFIVAVSQFILGEWKKGSFDGNGIFLHFTGVLIKGHFSQGKLDGVAETFYCRDRKNLNLWKNGTFYQEIPISNNGMKKTVIPKGLLGFLILANSHYTLLFLQSTD